MKSESTKNAATWFELPATDLARAQRFYEAVLGAKLRPEKFAGMDMAIFPYQEGVGGALVHDARFRPSADGAVVYLAVEGSLDACVRRVEEAGGKVVLPKTDIGDPGFIALVLDSEGNRVGLHSPR
jgi:predicted enzyme related to lactoylglutathione lyase